MMEPTEAPAAPADTARGCLESAEEYYALKDLADDAAADWTAARPLAPGYHQCVAVPVAWDDRSRG